MKLSEINLNLLLQLKVLLEKRNTSIAAKLLNQSQSSISQSLKQLRNIFQDELLTWNRSTKSAILSEKALLIKAELAAFFSCAEATFTDDKEFIPYLTEKKLRFAMSDLVAYFFLPEFINILQYSAPKASFSICSLDTYYEFDIKDLENIDLIFCDSMKLPVDFKFTNLYNSKLRLASSLDNHKTDSITTLKEIKNFKQIIIYHGKGSTNLGTNIDKYKTLFYEPDEINFVKSPYSLSALEKVQNSNDYLIIDSEVLLSRVQKKFKIKLLPFKTKLSSNYRMCWSIQKHELLYHKWVRSVAKKAFDIAFKLK